VDLLNPAALAALLEAAAKRGAEHALAAQPAARTWLSAKSVGKRLDMSAETARHYLSEWGVTPRRIGSTWRYASDEVERAIAEHLEERNPKPQTSKVEYLYTAPPSADTEVLPGRHEATTGAGHANGTTKRQKKASRRG
jgi:hypothetical protein